jgi:hypothetical protein
VEPDWAQIHRELKRKHVTLTMLWDEYIERCPEGYRYSRFCELYRGWASRLSVTMRQAHIGGDELFVDYAGDTVPVIVDRLADSAPSRLHGDRGFESISLQRGVCKLSVPRALHSFMLKRSDGRPLYNGKLLLAEFLVPRDGKPNWTLFVDLLMLGEITGKERTKSEFSNLLAETGFNLDRLIDTGSNIYLLEASVV